MNKENTQIQKFYNDEFGSIEILMIEGKPHFPAADCAKLLGYSNPRDAVKRHCLGDGVVKHDGVSFTTNQHGIRTDQTVEKTFIDEGNLYRLIIRSKLPGAIRFERWVFDEVLPAIRKYGGYITPDMLDKMKSDNTLMWKLARALNEELEKNEALQDMAEEMYPKAAYCDLIMDSTNAIPVTLIAKEYGMAAARFNSILHALGIQFKVGGAWALYADYDDQGYTKTLTYYVNRHTSVLHMFWTQKGRRFLYETLKKHGILPLAERPRDSLFGDYNYYEYN